MKKIVFLFLLFCSVLAFGATKEEPIEPNFKPYIFNLKQLRITWIDGSIKSRDKVEIRIYDNMNLEENENFKREEFVYDSWKIYYDITYNFNYGEEYFIKIIINNKKTYLLKTNAYSGKPLSENIFLFYSEENRAFDKAISKTGLFIATAANGKLRIRNMKGNLLSEFSGFSNFYDKIDLEFNPNKENELFIVDNEYRKITVVDTMTQNVIEEYDNRGIEVKSILFSDNEDYFVTVEKKNYSKVFSLWKRGNKNAKFTKTGDKFTVIKCFKDYILYLEGDDIMKCDFEGKSTKLFSVEKYYSDRNGISDGVYNENKKTFLLSFGTKIFVFMVN